MGGSCSRVLTVDLNNDGRPDLEQIIEEVAKRVLLSILESSESQPATVPEARASDHTTGNTARCESSEI
jgi:hypothetical protein